MGLETTDLRRARWLQALVDMNEQAEALKRRTKQFALDVISLVRTLPPGEPFWTVGGQLTRSATSVGANYRSACRARSHADFVAKIALVEEESDESGFWLEIVKDSRIASAPAVEPLLKEADELTAIFARSTMTARQSANRHQSSIINHQFTIA